MLPIRVLIVDDHPLMREALVSAIGADPDLTVAGEAATGQQAVQRYAELRPDVVIMDLFMPGMDGVAATAAICTHDARARILVLTSLTEEAKVMQAVSAGALGYLLKDASRAQILEGVRRVAAGEPFLPPATAGKLIHALHHRAQSAESLKTPETPTARELDVLALAATGLTDAEIAARLALSGTTVRVHLHNAVAKLRVHDRGQAIAWYWSQHQPMPEA